MHTTIATSAAATPRQTLAHVRTTPAKASLRTQPGATVLRVIVSEAVRRVTSQKAAAIEMQIDEGHLSRQLKDGSMTIARLEVLGEPLLAELGALLVEQYGALRDDPRERARHLLPQLIEIILEATK